MQAMRADLFASQRTVDEKVARALPPRRPVARTGERAGRFPGERCGGGGRPDRWGRSPDRYGSAAADRRAASGEPRAEPQRGPLCRAAGGAKRRG